MDNCDSDFLDLVEEAFEGKSVGEIAFGALKGFLDVYGARGGSACAEFSWEGRGENDPACGRRWAKIGTAGKIRRPLYITQWRRGFVCESRLSSSTAW
jgi:hypothetical protein